MEEGKILLIGNETDILHCGFSFPLSDGGKRYPSAYHYAHSMILTQLGLDEVHILELLATPSAGVATKARELLLENMPTGHDMNSLAPYLTTSRQSYTMAGLRLRAEQDKRFRQALMDTGEALLLVCDRRDAELGVGMDDEEFVKYTRRIRADAETISMWMREERSRPSDVGQNQLGFFLMWLRYEIKEKERARWMTTNDVKAQSISTDQDDQPIEISVSDLVVSLQGIFQPLSNHYSMNFEIKGETYRSVEHYAYQRLFESMKLSDFDVMKIRTSVKPTDVGKMARRLFKTMKIEPADLAPKLEKLDRWRQSAMKHKISKNEHLQQLLLSTGHAILIENDAGVDSRWSACTDEFELQHLLAKKYVTPSVLIDWMVGRKKKPTPMAHLGRNKTGLLLMELRTKFAAACTHRIPLVSPLETNILRTSVSNHMICFTPESVLHPFYSCEVKSANGSEIFCSAIHCVADAALKFFNVCKEDAEWVREAALGPECWSRLHHVITEQMMPPVDKIQQWYMTERQAAIKAALCLQFEQNPALLRVLLDTGDALLVSCARFSTTEAELNIGMRERDLRLWLAKVRADARTMIDLCLRPMAFRPPYFGGNRIGIIMMEIRREFILKGVFPQQLPDLGISVDAILGSESPMENYVPHFFFDILSDENYLAVWANAFLLMAKQDGVDPKFWQMALSTKTAPTLLSIDEAMIDRVMTDFRRRFDGGVSEKKLARRIGENGDAPDGAANGVKSADNGNGSRASATDTSAPSTEVMRAVFAKLAASFHDKMSEDEMVQREISNKSRENSQMQEMRRALEKTHEQTLGKSSGGMIASTPSQKSIVSANSALQAPWNAPTSLSNSPANMVSGSARSPRSSRNSVGPNDGQRGGIGGRPPHNQLDPFAAIPGAEKFPSLLSDFSAAAVAATAAAGATGISPATAALLEKNFEKELQKILPKLAASSNANNAMDMNRKPLLPHYRNFDNRGGGGSGGRPFNQSGGRRSGGGGGGVRSCPSDRSPSPMTAYYQHQNLFQPPPQLCARPAGGGGPPPSLQNRPLEVCFPYQTQSIHPSRQSVPLPHSSALGIQAGAPTADVAVSAATVPAAKKPKRVVDESELSEGEILSDDDE